MIALLRQLRRGPKGEEEYADTEFNGDSITIGSAADRDIQLIGAAVAADHAVIRRSGGKDTLSGRGGARFTIAGEARTARALQVGDVIGIGENLITVLDPPGGFDLALAIQLNTDVDKSEFEAAFKTELDQTWLSKRRTSWMLLLLTGVFAFAIPLTTGVLHRDFMSTAPWLPDDSFWSAGPLIPAHAQAIGRRCEACHRQFFRAVADDECRKCHDRVGDHVLAAHLSMTQLGPPQRCGSCHEEHNAPEGSIVIHNDALCTACHAGAHSRFGTLKVDEVRGFSAKDHPAFKASVYVPMDSAAAQKAAVQTASSDTSAVPELRDITAAERAGVVSISWQTTRVALDSGKEHSNLKFSHAEHLDVNKVQRLSDGKALGCADCHGLDADGEHFVPISMARSCSACHELTFDEQVPDRQLPHGKPRDAMLTIEDYYARKFSDPAHAVTAVARRQIPDAASAVEICTEATLACGARHAELEITNQFTRRGCISCHVVSDNHANDIHARFQVLPVKLMRDYFPDTHFSHRTHAVQKELTGDAACLSCHKSRDSTDSQTLLLPALGKCLECHADSPSRDRVALNCVSCHAYHEHP